MIAEALFCLAQNIYFEARSQPLIEQVAVAQVVLNRVHSPNYPDTVCAVVCITINTLKNCTCASSAGSVTEKVMYPALRRPG